MSYFWKDFFQKNGSHFLFFFLPNQTSSKTKSRSCDAFGQAKRRSSRRAEAGKNIIINFKIKFKQIYKIWQLYKMIFKNSPKKMWPVKNLKKKKTGWTRSRDDKFGGSYAQDKSNTVSRFGLSMDSIREARIDADEYVELCLDSHWRPVECSPCPRRKWSGDSNGDVHHPRQSRFSEKIIMNFINIVNIVNTRNFIYPRILNPQSLPF